MKDKNGYLIVSVCTKGHDSIGHSSYPLKVHRLQAFQKYGELLFEKGVQVRHLNNIQCDNSIDNIEIGSQSQNQLDISPKIRIERATIASKASIPINTIFTDEKIEEIGEFVHSGQNLLKDAIEKFNISARSLSRIIKKYREKYNIEKTPEMINLSRSSAGLKCRKWTDEEVEEIRKMKKDGMRTKDIKEKFNLSDGSFWFIMTNDYKSKK